MFNDVIGLRPDEESCMETGVIPDEVVLAVKGSLVLSAAVVAVEFFERVGSIAVVDVIRGMDLESVDEVAM